MLTLVRHVICAPHSSPDKYYTAASQRPSVLASDQHPSTLSITHPSDSLIPSYRIRSCPLANERASLGSRLIRQTHAQVSTRSTMMRTGTDAAERLEGVGLGHLEVGGAEHAQRAHRHAVEEPPRRGRVAAQHEVEAAAAHCPREDGPQGASATAAQPRREVRTSAPAHSGCGSCHSSGRPCNWW